MDWSSLPCPLNPFLPFHIRIGSYLLLLLLLSSFYLCRPAASCGISRSLRVTELMMLLIRSAYWTVFLHHPEALRAAEGQAW